MHTSQKNIFRIRGMHCASCAQDIENYLKRLSGVIEANVSFVNGRAAVEYDKSKIDSEKIKKMIEGLGYFIEESGKESAKSLISKYFPVFQVILVGLFLLLSWLTDFLGQQVNLVFLHRKYLEDFFAVLAIAVGWWPILKNAVKTVLAKNLNVKVLVSIAVIASLFIGAFKEAATVIFIVLLAGFLENFTLSKTSQAIKKLMELAPKTVTIKRSGGEMTIPIEEVKVKDLITIKPGERVGVDGELLTDEAQVDQSIITGESMPVIKRKGEKILAGSISDGSYFEIEAIQIGEDTTLVRIQKLVQEAQSKKAPIQRLTDKFAKYFVPSVLFIAFLIGIITFDLTRAITVLIVACPCAFVIAPPVSMVAAIGRGAKRGILIKDGEHLEKLGEIDTVIFDKTGTLTLGKPQVLEIKRFGGHSEKEIIELAAALESRSEHHLAKAILQKAKELEVSPKEPQGIGIEIIKGKGIIGKHNHSAFYLGNLALIKEHKINLPQNIASYIQIEEQRGHTVVIVAHDGEACGVICLSDQLRQDARITIENLKNLGIKNIWMITGDNKTIAQNMSEDLGIDEYFAEMLPQDKIDQIKKLQKQGKKVIMIGDGINDAPALAQADVGIAMGSGTDIALESGNIVLMKDDLAKIPETIKLGRKAVTVIKQNLTFALGFNFLMFALASFGIIHMIGGAVFHQINSLFVILNAMRLLI